ncbi:MAG TPA: hypothetical protein VLG37_02365 [Candidatus Saccharimonadales bacterium]|nr:hypothetical protein [Candidatus Saccharimonadales bacterium]
MSETLLNQRRNRFISWGLGFTVLALSVGCTHKSINPNNENRPKPVNTSASPSSLPSAQISSEPAPFSTAEIQDFKNTLVETIKRWIREDSNAAVDKGSYFIVEDCEDSRQSIKVFKDAELVDAYIRGYHVGALVSPRRSLARESHLSPDDFAAELLLTKKVQILAEDPKGRSIKMMPFREFAVHAPPMEYLEGITAEEYVRRHHLMVPEGLLDTYHDNRAFLCE